MTKPEFLKIMAYLEAGSGARPITEIQAEVYWDFLKDLPADSVQCAAKQALAESEYPVIPAVGVLLRLSGIQAGEIKPDDRAVVAYGAASRAVQTEGGYRSVSFDDPLVNAVIRNMGGWETFCDWPVDEIQWRRRDFLQHYAALSRVGIGGELALPLAGICDRENLATGHSDSVQPVARIACGLPPQGPAVIRGEIPAPKGLIAGLQRRITGAVKRVFARMKFVRREVLSPVESVPARPVLSDQELADLKAKRISEFRRRIAVQKMEPQDFLEARDA